MIKVILKDEIPIDEGRTVEFAKDKKDILSKFIKDELSIDECLKRLCDEDN